MDKRLLPAVGMSIAIAGICFSLMLIFFMGRSVREANRAYKEHRRYRQQGAFAALVPMTTAITFVGLSLYFIGIKKPPKAD